MTRKLIEDLTVAAVEVLHYFDRCDRGLFTQSFDEVLRSTEEGKERYLNDPVFRAKVMHLVSRMSAVIRGVDE